MMNRIVAIALLAGFLLFAILVLISGSVSSVVVCLIGFIFVVGGTLLTAAVSQSFESVTMVLRSIPKIFKSKSTGMAQDRELFLRVSNLHRRGDVRMAEQLIVHFQDDLLRQGAQLVIDRCNHRELVRTLHWQIAKTKEQNKQKLRVLQSMSGFAPAFGMLGTLFGLIHLLFGLGENSLAEVGQAMGFAMITTVYGLVLANVVIKPIVMKMEQQNREILGWMLIKFEAVLMLYDKQHEIMIQESLDVFSTSNPETAKPLLPPNPELVGT